MDRWNARTNEWEGGQWRSEIGEGLPSISNRSGGRVRANNEAWNVHESFKDYFLNEASLPWQHGRVTFTGRDD